MKNEIVDALICEMNQIAIKIGELKSAECPSEGDDKAEYRKKMLNYAWNELNDSIESLEASAYNIDAH